MRHDFAFHRISFVDMPKRQLHRLSITTSLGHGIDIVKIYTSRRAHLSHECYLLVPPASPLLADTGAAVPRMLGLMNIDYHFIY